MRFDSRAGVRSTGSPGKARFACRISVPAVLIRRIRWIIVGGMSIPVTTTFTIEGYRIRQYLGVVRGLIVRAPTISQGILGGLKSIIGGQVGAYTEMCEQTRQQAYDLLID